MGGVERTLSATFWLCFPEKAWPVVPPSHPEPGNLGGVERTLWLVVTPVSLNIIYILTMSDGIIGNIGKLRTRAFKSCVNLDPYSVVVKIGQHQCVLSPMGLAFE
eukprot:g66528.t1